MYLIIDIETVANPRINDYLKDKKYTAPSNYKDPEKIEASIKEQRQKDMERAGLYWFTGQIICICVSNMDGINRKAFYGDDERSLLKEFLSYISIDHPNGKLIGKNSSDFDIPFIVGRILSHNLGLTSHFRFEHSLSDIDHIFSRYASCGQRSTLADYAFGLGIKGKLGHGSQVQSMYNETISDPTKWKEITTYCDQDVEIVREMLTRYYKDFDVTTNITATESIPIPF